MISVGVTWGMKIVPIHSRSLWVLGCRVFDTTGNSLGIWIGGDGDGDAGAGDAGDMLG